MRQPLSKVTSDPETLLQSVDSGCKKIVKNRSAEEVEINSKKQKRMTDHFSFLKKERSVFSKTRLPLQASSSIRHVTRHYSCSDGQKCPVSEHCHTWYLMLHLQIFFLFLPKLLHWKKYIFYVSEMTICFCSLHPKFFPPPFSFCIAYVSFIVDTLDIVFVLGNCVLLRSA